LKDGVDVPGWIRKSRGRHAQDWSNVFVAEGEGGKVQRVVNQRGKEKSVRIRKIQKKRELKEKRPMGFKSVQKESCGYRKLTKERFVQG